MTGQVQGQEILTATRDRSNWQFPAWKPPRPDVVTTQLKNRNYSVDANYLFNVDLLLCSRLVILVDVFV